MGGSEGMGSKGNQKGSRGYKAGYEYLLAYKITIPIYDYTVVFCRRCQSSNYPDFPNLSSTRTYDQMVQAARSGSQNIPEGNQQAIYLQKRLQQSLEEKFVREGGFRENLFKKRLAKREKTY